MAAAGAGMALVIYLFWPGHVYEGPYDLIIRNGVIVDGLGNAPFRADIGIQNGRIAAIGNIKRTEGEQVIDAEGQVIVPGFIDVHTHVERNMPEGSQPFYAPNFVYQGVTTIITGNCGTSALSVKDIFKRLKKNRSQVNVASFIGHNTIRRSVMKAEDREPNSQELEKMKESVSRAMRQGALGLSTGLAYVPGAYAKKGELLALAEAAANGGGIYVSHIRDEGLQGKKAIAEACEIGERARLPVHISHFKASGQSQWGTAGQRLALVEEAQSRGLQVTIDQYPYTASSTGLELLIPAWVLSGGRSEINRRLRDSFLRTRIRSDMIAQLQANGWSDYYFARIAYCSADLSLNGLTIPQVTALQAGGAPDQKRAAGESRPHPATGGSSESYQKINYKPTMSDVERQANMILDLMIKGGAQMIYFDMSQDDVVEIMKHADTMFGSDSGVRSENAEAIPHPRGMGTFPRVISEYVQEQHLFSFEEAVRRMTSLPAKIFRLKKRGQITEGYWADLVILNQNYVLDRATYENPLKTPQGIYYVIVNGATVFENDHLTGQTPGRPVRRQRFSSN